LSRRPPPVESDGEHLSHILPQGTEGRPRSVRAHTSNIAKMGFSGYLSVASRTNFRVGGQDTTPQSLTAHTRGGCCKQFLQTDSQIYNDLTKLHNA
jgi:hypothetical protein